MTKSLGVAMLSFVGLVVAAARVVTAQLAPERATSGTAYGLLAFGAMVLTVTAARVHPARTTHAGSEPPSAWDLARTAPWWARGVAALCLAGTVAMTVADGGGGYELTLGEDLPPRVVRASAFFLGFLYAIPLSLSLSGHRASKALGLPRGRS